MGSDSDLLIMKDAAEILEHFDISYDLTIVSAHRTPERMVQYALDAAKKGIKVIIAGAGGFAHLPGMIASLTSIPVIGVPIKGLSLDGLDSLLSILRNASWCSCCYCSNKWRKKRSILACQMLGIENKILFDKIEKYKIDIKNIVLSKASKLEQSRWKGYLS